MIGLDLLLTKLKNHCPGAFSHSFTPQGGETKKSALQLLHSGWGTNKWCYQPPEGITTRNHLFPITHHHHLPLLPPSMLNPEAITGFTRHLWTVFSFGCLGGHTRDPGTGQIQFTAARPMVMILTWRTVTGFIKSLIKMFSFTPIDC